VHTCEFFGSASTAGELFIALGLGFGAVGAGNGCAAGTFGHEYAGCAILGILVLSMDREVPLQKITAHG